MKAGWVNILHRRFPMPQHPKWKQEQYSPQGWYFHDTASRFWFNFFCIWFRSRIYYCDCHIHLLCFDSSKWHTFVIVIKVEQQHFVMTAVAARKNFLRQQRRTLLFIERSWTNDKKLVDWTFLRIHLLYERLFQQQLSAASSYTSYFCFIKTLLFNFIKTSLESLPSLVYLFNIVSEFSLRKNMFSHLYESSLNLSSNVCEVSWALCVRRLDFDSAGNIGNCFLHSLLK